MNSVQFKLRAWSAWAPGLGEPEAWSDWLDGRRSMESDGRPEVDFLPPLQRRRLSRMARMSFVGLESCRDAEAPEPPLVYASRHGEVGRSFKLLESLARDEGLSPRDFSLSVHNATTGLYSIFRGNTEPSVAIAAGLDTFPTALVEAAVQAADLARECLLVWVEEDLPEFYRPYLDGPVPTMVLGMRLAVPEAEARADMRLSWTGGVPGESQPACETDVLAALMSVLLGRSPRTDWHGDRTQWRLEGDRVAT